MICLNLKIEKLLSRHMLDLTPNKKFEYVYNYSGTDLDFAKLVPKYSQCRQVWTRSPNSILLLKHTGCVAQPDGCLENFVKFIELLELE